MTTTYTEQVRRILAKDYFMVLHEDDLQYIDVCAKVEILPHMVAECIALRRVVLAAVRKVRYIEITVLIQCPDDVEGPRLLQAVQHAIRDPFTIDRLVAGRKHDATKIAVGMIQNVDEVFPRDYAPGELEERFEVLRQQGNIAHAMNYDIPKK